MLFADEPTAALDSALGRLVMETLRDVAHERQTAVLVVTHDTRAIDVFDRVLRMEDGRICGQ
jgi:putative ABC transport system ATP-binding protein